MCEAVLRAKGIDFTSEYEVYLHHQPDTERQAALVYFQRLLRTFNSSDPGALSFSWAHTLILFQMMMEREGFHFTTAELENVTNPMTMFGPIGGDSQDEDPPRPASR
jgi:hypothetical protein